MSRFEIRTWSKSEDYPNGSMHYSRDNIRITSLEGMIKSGVEVTVSTAEDGVIWMQSTGVLDKKGKEIFESDIIRDCGYGEFDVEFNQRWLVEWTSWCGPCFTASGEQFINFREIEIVGNKYENPELLKLI